MKPILLKTSRPVTGIGIAAALLFAIAATCSAATSKPTSAVSGSFRALDYLALIGYLVVIVAIGAYFSRREKSTDDFFLAGRRIPWWAASLSIFSTHLSAVTFMAIPATAFAKDWVRRGRRPGFGSFRMRGNGKGDTVFLPAPGGIF